jgi:hypothetical protein
MSKQIETEQHEEKEIIWEVGASEAKGGIICCCIRGFSLRTMSDAPSIIIRPGQLVGLSPTMASEMFYTKKVLPYSPGIPERGIYSVIYPFVTVIDGKYRGLNPGTEIELEKNEAIEYLLKNKVRLLREVHDNEIKIDT